MDFLTRGYWRLVPGSYLRVCKETLESWEEKTSCSTVLMNPGLMCQKLLPRLVVNDIAASTCLSQAVYAALSDTANVDHELWSLRIYLIHDVHFVLSCISDLGETTLSVTVK